MTCLYTSENDSVHRAGDDSNRLVKFYTHTYTHTRTHARAHTHLDLLTPIVRDDDSNATAEAIANCAGIAPFNSLQG